MSSSSSSLTVDSMNKRKYDTVKEENTSTTTNSMNKRKRDTMEEKNEKQQIFAPCDIKFMQKKSSETSASPDPLLTSVIFATHDEINAMEDLTDQYIVLTGKMAEMFDGKISKSSENKTEAKRLTKLLGGKWSSSISGKTTVLVVGPRAYWKCNGEKTQAAKKYRREGGKIKFWTSKQFGCYLLNRSASKSKKAKP